MYVITLYECTRPSTIYHVPCTVYESKAVFLGKAEIMLDVFGNRICACNDTAEKTIGNLDGGLVFRQFTFGHVYHFPGIFLFAGIHQILVPSGDTLELDRIR